VRAVGEELIRVGPDLGQDGRRGGWSDAWDGHQQVALAGERDHHLLHLRVEPRDHLIEMVDVLQVQLTHQRVMVVEAALQCQGEVGDLGAHPAPGQIGQDRGSAFPVDESVDHRSTRDGADRGGHRVQFNSRVLEHSTQPL
jgi:hypothetical protein